MSRKSAPPRARRRWFRTLLIILGALLVFPIVQVGCVRVVNPPVTPLMLLRSVESRSDGRTAPPRRYEWIDFTQIPRPFLRCVLTSEDQRFFQHHGFDWREIEAAQLKARRLGIPPRGASTITMQCARSLFLWQGRSFIRKGLEAYYTFWMELILSKRRILEIYANVIEMGDGIYGIEAAARAHFGTSARGLDREQAALLTAILPNPRERDPRQPSSTVRASTARILRNEPGLKVPDALLAK